MGRKENFVAVTGADGFIGSHVVEALLGSGANVRALSAYNSFGSRGWLDHISQEGGGSLDIWSGDIRDPFFVDRFVEGADSVLHLAALIAIPFSYVAPQSYVEVNVNGTVNVLEAVRRHGVRRLVHTSTSETYGTALFTPITEAHPLQAQSPYSASKIGADHMVESYYRSFDVPAVIVRPFNTFGPRQSERAVIPTIIRQFLDASCDKVMIGDLRPVRDFNFVKDVANGFVTAKDAKDLDYGTPYNIGSGTAVTIEETVTLVRQIIGSDKTVEEQATRKRPAKSEVFELIADSNKFRNATGWQPEFDLRAGLVETVEWWRTELSSGRGRVDAGYQI